MAGIEDVLLSADSAFLSMEWIAMMVFATCAFPIQVYLSFGIYGCLEFTQRIYTTLEFEATKEPYGIFLWGRIPRLAVMVYSLKTSEFWGSLFTILFIIRIVIFVIDYVHAGIIYQHAFSKDESEKQENQLKESKPTSVDCALNHQVIPNKNSTLVDNEKSKKHEENTEEIDNKDEEENIMECKCEIYIARFQKLREDCDKLGMDKDLMEIKLRKTIEDYKKSCEYSGKQLARLEEEKRELSAQLKAAVEMTTHSEDDYYRSKLAEERWLWDEDRNDLRVKLSSYQQQIWSDYEIQYKKLAEERNDVASKLYIAKASAEYYKTCWDTCEESCRNLREENAELSAKLFSETVSAEHFLKLMHEFEDKCRRLEEEKSNLCANLCAAEVTAEIYRTYMHNCPP